MRRRLASVILLVLVALALADVAAAKGRLEIAAVSASPVSRPGGVVRVTHRIANVSRTPVQPSRITYRLGRTQLGTRRLGRLRPGAARRGAAVLTIPASTPPGRYAVVVCVPGTCRKAAGRISVAHPPEAPVFSEYPRNPTNAAVARFAFVGPARGFRCSLNGARYTPCTSPVEVAGLGDGVHTFRVQARDREGRVGPPASVRWEIDRTPPAAPAIIAGPRTPTNDTQAAFSYASPGATGYLCGLDGSPYAPCGSSYSVAGLREGAHSFVVRAADAAGNAGQAAVFQWVVDTTPPEAPAITVHPPALTNSRDASFVFGSGDPQDRFLCRLASGAFAPCSSPAVFVAIPEGEPRFEVKAVDPAGNQGEARTYTWTTDYTPPPAPTISARPWARTFARIATFEFAGHEEGVTFRCSLDGGAAGACTSPATYSRVTGPHSFSVVARDRAGNDGSPARADWVIDRREDGVFRGGAGQAAVVEFENWLGRQVTKVLTPIGRSNWTDIEQAAGITLWLGSRYELVVAVPMLASDGSTLAQGAAGAYNRHFVGLAERLVAAGYGDAVIRLGWEFNGDWFPWSAKDDPNGFIGHWRQIVGAMRSVSGAKFSFEWSPNQGKFSIAPDLAYPGDDYVDLIGVTAFDIACCDPGYNTPTGRWQIMLNQPYGLKWHRDFAQAHGKPMSYAEWGLWRRPEGTGGGDNPYYIERFREWLDANNVAYALYFEWDGDDGPHQLMTGQYPNGAKKYLELFGPPLP